MALDLVVVTTATGLDLYWLGVRLGTYFPEGPTLLWRLELEGMPLAEAKEAFMDLGVLWTSDDGLLSLQHWNMMARRARTKMVPPAMSSIVWKGCTEMSSEIARFYSYY